MSNFTIHKHHTGTWSVEKSDCICDLLSWDEMLGEVACLLMAGKPHRHSCNFVSRQHRFGAIYSLSVTEVEPGWYTIRRASRFVDRLGCSEALAFLAAYTLTDGERQLFGGLLTYEQWVNRFRWNRERSIGGLLSLRLEEVA